MQFKELWEAARQADSFILMRDEVLLDLGYSRFAVLENELVLGLRLAAEVYREALQACKGYRINRELTADLLMLLDLSVLINGEFALAWHIKQENISVLDIDAELHFNKLSIKLHRKAAIAYEYRKLLIGLSDCIESEISLLSDLAEMHKQNYYLWEYRRFLFDKGYIKRQSEELGILFAYCEKHPSDSSGLHYLYSVVKALQAEEDGELWVNRICKQYYGPDGLYNEKKPPGYESVNLFRAKLMQDKDDIVYFNEQILLGRNPKLINKART